MTMGLDDFFRALTGARAESVGEIEVNGRTTTATVKICNDAGDEFVGKGRARCRADDHLVPSIGDGIATGRALIAIGKQMIKTWSVRSITEETYQVNVAPLKEAVAKATE